MSQRFRSHSRSDDVKHVFEQITQTNPRVFEIGCADGRDAEDIRQYTNDYLGIDIAERFIDISNNLVPDTKFLQADALTYDYPKDVDVIFAFASLLHFTKDQTRLVLEKSHAALRSGGLMRISLKNGQYGPMERNDDYGKRLFYLYDLETIELLSKDLFKIVWSKEGIVHAHDSWLELLLQKPS